LPKPFKDTMTALKKLMCADWPLAYGAAAVYPWSESAAKKYRFKSRFGDEVLLHKKVSLEGQDYLFLPRALCEGVVGIDTDERDHGEPVQFPKCPTPKPEQ